MSETWKPLDVQGYEVSDEGRVRSLARLTPPGRGHRRLPERVMHPQADPVGYLRVKVARRMRHVHRLVLEAFVGPCPPGHNCNHLDGVKGNNQLANLQWSTPSENTRHAIRLGLCRPTGEQFTASVAAQRAKTHCKRGHAFTPENTRVAHWRGWRMRRCRACHREDVRRDKAAS